MKYTKKQKELIKEFQENCKKTNETYKKLHWKKKQCPRRLPFSEIKCSLEEGHTRTHKSLKTMDPNNIPDWIKDFHKNELRKAKNEIQWRLELGMIEEFDTEKQKTALVQVFAQNDSLNHKNLTLEKCENNIYHFYGSTWVKLDKYTISGLEKPKSFLYVSQVERPDFETFWKKEIYPSFFPNEMQVGCHYDYIEEPFTEFVESFSYKELFFSNDELVGIFMRKCEE